MKLFLRGMESESNWLVQMRKKLGLTQEDIARAVQVTPRTIINWKNGHHEPRMTIRQTKALCRILKIMQVKDLPDDMFETKQEND